MFSFIGTLIIGLVVGAIAKLLMPGKDPGGFIITISVRRRRLVRCRISWTPVWVGIRKGNPPDLSCPSSARFFFCLSIDCLRAKNRLSGD